MTRIEIDQEDFNKKLAIAMDGVALDVQEALKEKLTQGSGKDTGNLQGNIKAVKEGNTITISMPEYAKYVEFGTPGTHQGVSSLGTNIPANPGRKMPVELVENNKFQVVEGLQDWASRHGSDNAWGLAKHIQLYGTRPHPFIRPTFNNEVVDIIRNNLIDAFK